MSRANPFIMGNGVPSSPGMCHDGWPNKVGTSARSRLADLGVQRMAGFEKRNPLEIAPAL